MNSLIESILDSDIDIKTKLNDSYDAMVRKWLHSDNGNNIYVMVNKDYRKIDVGDYEIVNHVIFFKDFIDTVTIYDMDIPEYVNFGYVGKTFGLRNSKAVNVENIFRFLDNKGLKELRYIDIIDNKKLKKLFDMHTMKNIRCLTITGNPNLKVDVDKLTDTHVSITIMNNKNKIDIKELDRKHYIYYIAQLDDYDNSKEYNVKND